ncbi:MAG: AAA family ATPase, partial [Actinomycetes bacterium]
MDLEFIVAESREARLPALTPRRLDVPDIPNKAAVLIGMRRSGKTYLMYQEMQRLLASGVDRRDVLYVNFEDDRLQPAEPGLLSDLLEAHYRVHPAPRERRAYLFLDEIQMVPGWPRFVRRILDTEL